MIRHNRRVYEYLTLLLLTSVTAAVDPNPLVSDGICYYGAGKQANGVYIPCGNDAFGVYACCMEGDTCMSSNACYNAQYGNVYIAGCTDPSYSNAACGNKGLYGDLQWASLVRCFLSNDTTTNKEEWAACDESNQPVVTKHDGGCVCTASAHTAVFTDNPVLTNFAVLPDATGKSISFAPGHTPPTDLTVTSQSVSSTSTPSSRSTVASTTATNSGSSASVASSLVPTSSTGTTASSSSTSSGRESTSRTTTGSARASSSTASTTDSASSSTSTDASGPVGLSTAAMAGIGVGAGLGVLLVCAILFLLYRRRQKKQTQLREENAARQPFIPPTSGETGSGPSPAQAQFLLGGKGSSRMAEMPVPAWSGYKSELPATERRSELLGSTQPSTLTSSTNVSEADGTPRTTRMHDVVSPFTSSATSGWGQPSSDGTQRNSYAQRNSYQQPVMSGRIQTVHELPGSYT